MPKMSFREFQKSLGEGKLDLPDPKNTICWYLAQPNPSMLRYQLDTLKMEGARSVPEAVRKHIVALNKWFETRRKSKDSFLPFIQEMVKCPKRANWTKHTTKGGKAWRGVNRTPEQLKSTAFTGQTVKIMLGSKGKTWSSSFDVKFKESGKQEFFVAKGVYKSQYAMQSWTSRFEVAYDFATADPKNCPVICEANLNPDETFFNPEQKFEGTTDMLGLQFTEGEYETIRVSNKPINITMYIPVGWFASVLSKATTNRMKKLVDLVGKKNADALAASPTMKKLLGP